MLEHFGTSGNESISPHQHGPTPFDTWRYLLGHMTATCRFCLPCWPFPIYGISVQLVNDDDGDRLIKVSNAVRQWRSLLSNSTCHEARWTGLQGMWVLFGSFFHVLQLLPISFTQQTRMKYMQKSDWRLDFLWFSYGNWKCTLVGFFTGHIGLPNRVHCWV